MSVMEPSDKPFSIVAASKWEGSQIESWLKSATEGSELEKLWTEFIFPHFRNGKSLRFESISDSTPRTLSPMEIEVHGITVEVYSSWCAIAVVLNRKLPPYDLETGNVVGYAYSILFLFAKWSDAIKIYLRDEFKQWGPIVFSVSFAEGENLLDASKNLAIIISNCICVNLESSKTSERLRLCNEWGAGKRRQIAKLLFNNDDNPLDEEEGLLALPGKVLRAPVKKNLTEARIKQLAESTSPRPVTHKTLSKYYEKQWPEGGSSDLNTIRTTIGVCAEAWGIMMMGKKVKPGGHFTTISIAQDIADVHVDGHAIKLLDGYKLTGPEAKLKLKLACYNCIYLYSALKAMYDITMHTPSKAEINANYDPEAGGTLVPSNAEDSETPEDSPSSSRSPTKRTVGSCGSELQGDKKRVRK